MVGSIFGIASGDALSGEEVETALVGVFDLAKTASQAWIAGDKVYWDDTNKVVTKTATGTTTRSVTPVRFVPMTGEALEK